MICKWEWLSLITKVADRTRTNRPRRKCPKCHQLLSYSAYNCHKNPSVCSLHKAEHVSATKPSNLSRAAERNMGPGTLKKFFNILINYSLFKKVWLINLIVIL